MSQRPYPSQQMSSQEVSQFISTYGLPPPPNKYSPRRARLPGMPSDSYNAIGSIMSTPRGMKIGRRHESIGPDIEGGDFDDINEPDAPQKLQSIPESSATTKKAKKSKKKLDINPDDESDPDLQIVSKPT